MKSKHFLTMAASVLIVGQAMGDGVVPMENGAEVSRNVGCVLGWVDLGSESTEFFPNGEGLVLVRIEGAKVQTVTTSSGKLQFNCKGTLPIGANVEAIDFVTGNPINATLATYDEACAAVDAIGWDSCPGTRGPVLQSFDRVGAPCSFRTSSGQLLLDEDWLGVVTISGRATATCHFDTE